VGSGKTALETLLHEGGHAAHFANIDQASPLFSQVGCAAACLAHLPGT
jgi:oligoendopeptidase F